ncbi:signal recognition particle-docking protein FtsY [Janibacter hoylei PVAS-1]|uniref:Signal recognition particle receptor FtsY n=1 Tax=Janibacter hoylei PVAS-1 TaxID=1210046 RepID=K1DXF2_9MICO|nr:signal recognition particle-docking protein FtsY [Janibacter hoylei]EKA61074.1 signal recognition particle-docking protein FtsY [Janibacter hoylei PVAS-1]RWU81871.1 signal recognition particle-docking protein FtsY [Janibacter hoylei PVAS-1]
MGIDTLTEYIAVAVGLLLLLGGLAIGLLRGGRGGTKELPPERRPPERPKGSTDHRSGTIVLDRPSDHAKPQAPPEETKGEDPEPASPPAEEPAAPEAAAPETAAPETKTPAADDELTPVPSDEEADRGRTVPPLATEPQAPAEPEAPTQPDARAEPESPVGPEVPAEAPVDTPAPTRDRMRALRSRLARSNGAIGKGLLALLSQGKLSEEDWEEVEDTLLVADLGMEPTTELVDSLREHVSVDGTTDPEVAKDWLYNDLLQLVDPSMDRGLAASRVDDRPACILVVGVNGTGKTTTVGKLARVLVANDRDVLLGAADTFRAAAADQLETWGARVGVPTVRSDREGADPAAVAFDAVKAAADAEVDAVIIDTAGRLHNKVGLMDELSKVKRVIEKQTPIDEVLLVLDATTGQNGLAQAKVFAEAVDITGVVLTKLDGTAKGGIVVAVQRTLGVPVKLVGLGEGPDDLAPFVPEAFVDAIVG